MKDYVNNYISYNDKIINDGKLFFNIATSGLEGENVLVDNIPCKVIIQEHINPLNESKEDRKILIPNTIKFHRGSIVTWNNENWLIVNDIAPEDDNGVYIEAKILKELNTISWKFNNTGDIITYSCIATAQLLYTLGIQENKELITPDGRMNITIVADDITNKLTEDMRFIFNHKNIFKITYIDSITMPGLLTIVLKQDLKNNEDDMVNNVAYQTIGQTTTPTNLSISGATSPRTNSTNNVYTILNNTNNNTFTWSLIDAISGLTTSYGSVISSTTTTCTVSIGVTSGKQMKLLATCIEVPSAVLSLILTSSAGF